MSLLLICRCPLEAGVLLSHFAGYYSTSLWTRCVTEMTQSIMSIHSLPFSPLCLDEHWSDLAGFTLGLVGVIMFCHAHVLLDMAQRQTVLDLALYQQFCPLSALTHHSREDEALVAPVQIQGYFPFDLKPVPNLIRASLRASCGWLSATLMAHGVTRGKDLRDDLWPDTCIYWGDMM